MASHTAGFLVAASAFVFAAHGLAQPASTDPLQASRALTQASCGACHVVAPDAKDKPVLTPPAPSLVVVARRPAFSADALQKRLAFGHGRGSPKGAPPHPQLNDSQIEQVVGYVMSLRPAE
jgi:mono/diheme cytochrome c family protein